MVVEPGRGGGGWWVRGAAAHCTLHGRGEEEGEKIRNGGDRGVVSLHSQTRRWNTPVG